MYDYNSTPAEGSAQLKDAVDLITSTTVSGVLFAYSFLIYCLSMRLFYLQLRGIDGKLNYHTIITVVISSIIIICAMVDIVTLNLYARSIYSDIRTLPGGADSMLAEEPAFVPIKTNIIATFIETVVSLGTQSWRVRAIWRGTPFATPITIFAVLLSVAEAGKGWFTNDGASYIAYISIGWFSYESNPPPLVRRMLLSTLSLTTASMNYMTIVIIIRLMIARWQNIKLLGKSDSAALYLEISAMLIESFAPNAAWIIALLVSSAVNAEHAYNFFNDSIVQIEVITFFLVVYRVFSGRAWKGQSGIEISTLQWNHGTEQQVAVSAGRAGNGRGHAQESDSERTTYTY